MARPFGPIQGWFREDTVPTEAQGGYAGAASTASAIALFQDSVDALAEQVGDINVGVGSITARDNGDGTGTITWIGNASNGGGGGDGGGGTVGWSSVTGKPSTFPPSQHVHSMNDLATGGTATDRTFLRGDGQWGVPGTGAAASGGCIRLYAGGPEIHVNSTHVNTAITGFGPEGDGVDYINANGQLVIKHRLFGSAIITVGAFPDETLASRGIIAGVSGGVGTSLVQFSQNGTALDLNVQADYDKVAGPYSNLWLMWVHHAPSGAAVADPITEVG